MLKSKHHLHKWDFPWEMNKHKAIKEVLIPETILTPLTYFINRVEEIGINSSPQQKTKYKHIFKKNGVLLLWPESCWIIGYQWYIAIPEYAFSQENMEHSLWHEFVEYFQDEPILETIETSVSNRRKIRIYSLNIPFHQLIQEVTRSRIGNVLSKSKT